MIAYLAQRRKLIAAGLGAALAYTQTLLTPTGLAAHIVTGVILAGTAAGVWAVPNEMTLEQKAKVLREQSAARAAKRPPPEQP